MSDKTIQEVLAKAINEKNAKIEEQEEKIQELERELEEIEDKFNALKDGEDWAWRDIREISEEENLGLPLPRMELRYRRYDDFHVVGDYGLVIRHLLGQINFIPFGSTKIGGRIALLPDHLDTPFRDGGHLQNDAWELKLPAYVVNGKHFRKLDLHEDPPNALLRKMGEKPGPIP